MANISIKQMLEAGVHFGHRSQFWHPKMSQYIYGVRNKIHIIDLEKTLPMFSDALNFLSRVAASGGEVLFVGTKRSASQSIKTFASQCGMPYVDYRWLGGMLTNYKTIKASIKRLQDLEFLSEHNFAQFSKKEALVMTKEMNKLNQNLGGIKNMKGIPSAIFIIDIGYEKNAVKEARKIHIPIVAVVDSNYCPDNIDYVIPGNDDSLRSNAFYIKTLADVISDAKASVAPAEAAEEKTKVQIKPSQTKTKTEEKVLTEDSEATKPSAPVAVDKSADNSADTSADNATESDGKTAVGAEDDKQESKV